MLKVILHTSNQDELARTVNAPVYSDVCDTVTELMAAVESRCNLRVTKIAVHEMRVPESTSYQSPCVVNIGGKITHYPCADVHVPALRTSVQRQTNAFGVFMSIFTRAGNFHTSSTQTTTLFRGCASREAIKQAIMHVFVVDSVHEVLVNNIVFSARLGHPVSEHNIGIRQALEALDAGPVHVCETAEDNMFVHAFVLRTVTPKWLQTYSVEAVRELRVRINIGRTGVVNVFFGIAGGENIDSALDERLQPVCNALVDAMRSAV